jgi:excisionase family DNA binding protein
MSTQTKPRKKDNPAPVPPVGAAVSPYNPVMPSPETAAFAARLLSDFGRHVLLDTETGRRTKLDETVFLLLRRLLTDLAAGNAVSIIPHARELSTFQAAAILGVSRPFVIGLIEKGELAAHRVGTHRRIRMSDLLAYKAKAAATTDAALSELTRLSQDYGLY